jgi:hypothetical protein
MPLIDIDKICERQTDRIFKWFNIDTDPTYSPKFRRFVRFFGTKVIPTIFNIAIFFLLFYIFTSIARNKGIEALFVLFVTIYVMNLRLNSKK